MRDDSRNSETVSYITPLTEIWTKGVMLYDQFYPVFVMPFANDGNLEQFVSGNPVQVKDRLRLVRRISYLPCRSED